MEWLNLSLVSGDIKNSSLSQYAYREGRGRVGNLIMIVFTCFFASMILSCAPVIQYQPPVNDPLVFNENDNHRVSILSYNIQTIFGKNEGKVDALMQYINSQQYDFVLFQELFDESVRNHITSNIDRNAYKSVVSRIDYDSFPENIFQDAGLFLISRYPQIDLSTIPFNDQVSVSEGAVHMKLNTEISLSTDFLANKSVMGSLHLLSDSTYLFIFTTHVQALGSRSHKREQYRQIKDFIEYATYAVVKAGVVKSSEDMIVILTGDFNSDAYNDSKFETLQTDLGSPRDLHRELNPSNQEYSMMVKLFNLYARFDYIFAYNRLGSASFKKVTVESINTTDVKSNQEGSISDHMALKASISFIPYPGKPFQYHSLERKAK
jgi:endonuclease/exonuclease/phosphatase family metal-dependent hydrolase